MIWSALTWLCCRMAFPDWLINFHALQLCYLPPGGGLHVSELGKPIFIGRHMKIMHIFLPMLTLLRVESAPESNGAI